MVLDATVYAWDFDAADSRRRLGLDVRLGLPLARRRRPLDALHDRLHEPPLARVRRDPTRPGVVYAATVGGLHRSDDGGATWTRISRESLVVTALEIDRRSGRLYVGTEGEGVFYSDDGGPDARVRLARPAREPRGRARGRPQRSRAASSSSAPSPARRPASGRRAAARSARSRAIVLPASASLAAFRGKDGRTVLLVASSSGVRVSRDGGVHWQAPARAAGGIADRRSTARPSRARPSSRPKASSGPTTARVSRRCREGCGRPTPAQLLADRQRGSADRDPIGRDALSYWDGRSWSTRKKAALGGGIFMKAAVDKPVRRVLEPPGRRTARCSGRRAATAARSRARGRADARLRGPGRGRAGLRRDDGRRSLSLRALIRRTGDVRPGGP